MLTDTQHKVLEKSKSATSNLLEFADEISKYVDNNDNVEAITVDFTKAFDKPLYKINCYGISGKVLL